MTILEKVISVINSYPDLGNADVSVDYSNDESSNYTIAPSGMVVNNRNRYVTGAETLECQYNCGVFVRKYFMNGLSALENHSFIENLQFWLLSKNYDGSLPQVGDDIQQEFWTAVNGSMVEMNQDASTAVYSVQLTIEFIREY